MTVLTDQEWLLHVDAALAHLGHTREALGIEMGDIWEFDWRPVGIGAGDVPHAWIVFNSGRVLHVERGRVLEAQDDRR